MKRIEKIIKNVEYEAVDGKRFDSQFDCEQYERKLTLPKKLKAASAVPHKMYSANCLEWGAQENDALLFVRARTSDELLAFGDWLDHAECSEIPWRNGNVEDYVGKTLVFAVECLLLDDNDDLEDVCFVYSYRGTPDALISEYAKNVEGLLMQFNQEVADDD